MSCDENKFLPKIADPSRLTLRDREAIHLLLESIYDQAEDIVINTKEEAAFSICQKMLDELDEVICVFGEGHVHYQRTFRGR